MTEDELRHVSTGDAGHASADERLTPLVSGHDTETSSDRSNRDGVPETLLSSVGEALADGDAAIDESLVTESLDEILLALIASSTDQTHGTELMDELERCFDAQLSPGTVYPRLHELDSEGLLEMHELVQTKQYSISDDPAARERIERAVYQHLAIGMFLHASLDDA
ncbi:helix-turn-helix transcriptional regulator [Halomicrobium sp. IBSBa]|uniref:PadR family transcriptional regulator n=1 Tax=Halomicrobium sp. IBSBa TaxID=2778916 RepID=UPI001ABF596C|nr:helix-turn-helix transcriptional regulator [Halomicrobium sp. IBSBa]MBO4247501.1 helix-turn-helix transcriptional regulator [Halomicrobium sp. IBSBa]